MNAKCRNLTEIPSRLILRALQRRGSNINALVAEEPEEPEEPKDMDDPTQLKEGDVILVKKGDHPGIGMVMKIGNEDGDRTQISYRLLIGTDLRKSKETSNCMITIRYVHKLDRRQVAKMFEVIRSDLEESERIVSDAMFDGTQYYDDQQK